MKDRVYLDPDVRFFKGNLHLHTVWSDGSTTAKHVVDLFKRNGYDFITLPGMERGGLSPVRGKNPGFHFGAIDDPTTESPKPRYTHLQKLPVPVPWEGDHSPQQLIDELRSHGNLVIYNHPEWHLARFENMVKYDGFLRLKSTTTPRNGRRPRLMERRTGTTRCKMEKECSVRLPTTPTAISRAGKCPNSGAAGCRCNRKR